MINMTAKPVSYSKPLIILLTGFVTGLLDILAAIIKFYIDTGKGPEPIFRYIASGVFGFKAFIGGVEYILWGVILHFVIAIVFCIFLFLVFPKVYSAFTNWVVVGILFGIVVWAIMNFVVLPLSYVPEARSGTKESIIAALILIFMIGLPVAYVARGMQKARSVNNPK